MLIQRGGQVAGVDAVQARAVARALYHASVCTLEEIHARVGREGPSSIDGTRVVLKALSRAGFVTDGPIEDWELEDGQTGPAPIRGQWRNRLAGNALAKARIGKPMPRAKGERMLADLIKRAESYNADPEGLAWVDVVEVYGSLTDVSSETVGDVDVRVLASHRLDYQTYKARCYEIGGSSLIDILSAADKQLRRVIRNGSALIDLHLDLGKVHALPAGARVREVYRRHGCQPAEDGATRRGPDAVLPWSST